MTEHLYPITELGRRIVSRLLKGGTLVSDLRSGLNVIEGSGIALTATDNSGNDRVDLTIGFSSTIPSARVYRSTNQSISDSTDTILLFDSERRDTASLHSTSSNIGRLTAPVAGMYAITANVEFASNTSGRREMRLLLNGSTIIAQEIRAGAISGINSPIHLSTLYYLAQNDYVEVQVWQNRGGNLNVLASANFSPEFAMHWLSP